MYKYISTADINDIVSKYYQLAVDCAELHSDSTHRVYYVIFSMGSMVTISADESKDAANYFAGYTPEYMETWPMHRMEKSPKSPSAAEIYHDLVEVWRQQSAKYPDGDDITDVIKCGFKKLLGDNDGIYKRIENATPIICDMDDAYAVDFCGGINMSFCMTDSEEDNCIECVDNAISLRTFDLMFPQVYAVITPGLELILCTVEIDE